MLRIEDTKFKEAIKQLEAMNWTTRVEYFKQWWAERFLLWWFLYFREDFIVLLATFHYDWIEALFSGKNVMLEWFRWSIKTTTVLAATTFKIANWFTKFVVWQSYEDTASSNNTTNIARMLMNKRLEADYGKLFQLTWWKKEDLEKKSVSNFDTTNGVKVRAASLWQKLRWAVSKTDRPDLLIVDDIDVSDSVRNKDVIDKNYEKITWETFWAMTKTWEARIYFLGNTINQDWIVPRFRKEKKGTKNWIVFHQPLIIDNEVQWDFFTEDTLEKIKEDEWPVAFNQNYLLIPIDSYWEWHIKREHLRYYDFLNIDDFDNVFMHADTTHTAKATSDYFCSMVIWENKRDKNYYVIDFILEKMDVETQSKAYINQYLKYHQRVKKMTYDEKANQGFWFWVKKLAKEEYKISLPLVELAYPKDKVTHFEPHIPHFIANRIYLPSKHKDLTEAETQLLAFPTKWVHDDFVDWLSWVLDNYAVIKRDKKGWVWKSNTSRFR
jgi:predicted phage terminase large subunit-like protein